MATFSVYKLYRRRCGSVGHVPLIACDQQNDILILDLNLFVFANLKKSVASIITLLFLQNEIETVEYREFKDTVNIAQFYPKRGFNSPHRGILFVPDKSGFFLQTSGSRRRHDFATVGQGLGIRAPGSCNVRLTVGRGPARALSHVKFCKMGFFRRRPFNSCDKKSSNER